MENENKKITLGSLMKWVIIGILFLVGVTSLFIKPIIGVIILLVAGLFLPITDRFIKNKFGVVLSKGAKIGLIIFFIIIGSSSSNSLRQARDTANFSAELRKTEQVQVFDIPKVISINTAEELKKPEYELYVGKVKNEFIPTKEKLKIDPEMTSDITFEKDGKELMVEYDTKSKRILNYFVSDTSMGTKDLAGLYKIGNLSKDSKEYSITEQKSIKDPAIYTGLLVEPGQSKLFSDTQLRSEAEVVIEKLLKAPTTAKFSNSANIKKLPDNCFIISSSVDSQNSFGAMLHNSYSVELCHLGGVSITDPYNSPVDLKRVVFDGEQVFKK